MQIRISFLTALLALVLFISLAASANATVNSDAMAVRAILGEASGEGYEGMLAVACAIRNRDSLQGVYGLNARHVDNQPGWVWGLAREAWRVSEFEDVVDGADHWGSVIVDKKWIEEMERTMTFIRQVRNQRFYRE